MTGCVSDSKETAENAEIEPIEMEETKEFQADTIQVIDDEYYNLAFQEIKQMLEGEIPTDFKRAVFLVEWAYLNGNLDYGIFSGKISRISKALNQFIQEKGVGRYKTSGNYALFEFFTKPHKMNNYRHVFVSKLMETHKGQCR